VFCSGAINRVATCKLRLALLQEEKGFIDLEEDKFFFLGSSSISKPP
jgi:hypothetical protein